MLDTTGDAATRTALDDRAVRQIVNQFSVERAEGQHQDFIRKLAEKWHEFNQHHFEGRLTPAYLAISEPRSPRADGDCSPYSGHGGRLQIRLRPSHVAGTVNQGKVPLPGKTVRFMRPGHGIEYRERWLADILLHEMGHQFEMEVLGTEGGHGKDFCAICNRIGGELGLPPVVARRRQGDPKTLPICAQWPSNVRPEGYYGDLWDEVTGPTEAGEDPVLRLVAMFGALERPDRFRFLERPTVQAELALNPALLAVVDADQPDDEVTIMVPRPSRRRQRASGPRGSSTDGRRKSWPSGSAPISHRSARSRTARPSTNACWSASRRCSDYERTAAHGEDRDLVATRGREQRENLLQRLYGRLLARDV
jgi:hypothetical protein